MNGQAVAAAPTAATAPGATKTNPARGGGSAEDAVVTIPNPFQAAAGGTAPGDRQAIVRRGSPKPFGRLPAPACPAAAERPLFRAPRAEQPVQNRSIGTLAGQ